MSAAAPPHPPGDWGPLAAQRLAEHFCSEPELIQACLQGVEQAPAHWRQEVYAAARLALARQPNYADLSYYAGQAACAVGDLAEAARLAARALEINPDYMDAYILAARIATLCRRPREARAHLERALANGADYPDVHLLMGSLWQQEGDPRRARTCYQRALAMNANLKAASEALAALPAAFGNGTSHELPA